MSDILISRIEEQEINLQFKEFTNESALEIGMYLVNNATSHNHPIVIDITRGEQRLFFYACKGSSKDNEFWVERKKKITTRFGRSSMLTKLKYEKIAPEKFNPTAISLDSSYTLSGGCFPVIIKNTGVIGTITVSGLTDIDDHNMVVNAIEHYLKRQIKIQLKD